MHDDLGVSPKSHYFIRAARNGVRSIMEQLQPEFARVAGDVAGYLSLAKSEIVSLYRSRT